MFSSKPKPADDAPASDWKSRLKRGLALTGAKLKQVAGVFRSHPRIDEALYEALESQLLEADVGVKATTHLVESLRKAAKDKRLDDGGQLRHDTSVVFLAESVKARNPHRRKSRLRLRQRFEFALDDA